MIGQLNKIYTFDAFFSDAAGGVTGLSVTVDLYSPAGTLLVSGVAATEIGGGFYTYSYTTTSTGNYRAVFKTSGAVNNVHLPALWVIGQEWVEGIAALAGGSGSRAIILQLYQIGTVTPIGDVSITVLSGSDIIALAITNPGGQASLALNDGVYTLRLLRSGYVFSATTLTISGNGTVIAYGTAIAIPAPPSALACTLYEYCFDQAGEHPLNTVTATCEIISLPYDYSGKLHEGAQIEGIYSAMTGLVYWTIVRGAIVRVSIEKVGYLNIIEVPDSATARVSEQAVIT